jgi:ubiquinone/menaquinone biosynthesis C-methylase UbiE
MPDVVLELGCGNRKRLSNSIGIDVLDYESVDIVGDVFAVLEKIPDASVDAVHSHHFFEHVSPLDVLLRELARVIKPGGRLEVVVPHFSNPYFYSDYTHRQTFGLYSFSYLTHDTIFRRRVPCYQQSIRFELQDVRLVFKSARVFPVRYGFKIVIGKLFNLSNAMKEWYEEQFCWVFPCYELHFKLKRIKDSP